MTVNQKFVAAWVLLTLSLLASIGAMCYLLWVDLSSAEQAVLSRQFADHAAVFVLLCIIVMLICFVVLRFTVKAYVAPLSKLAEDIRIIQTVNPAHRANLTGASEVQQLASAVNSFAEVYRALQEDVATKINDANARLEAERNRLAALMSDLTQGVLVCNSEGGVLLYNARAKQLLDQPSRDKHSIGGAFIGLGRSIFAIMDKNLIVHALDTIKHQLLEGSGGALAHFVTARGGQLIRAYLAPILDRRKRVDGFVLTVDDITRSVEINSRRDALLQSLTEGTRASIANIRAAIETMLGFPDMTNERRQRFAQIINDEAENLSLRLTKITAEHADTLRGQWPMEDMWGSDLLSAIQRRLHSTLGVTVWFEPIETPIWLSVDSYSVVQAIAQVMARVQADFGVNGALLALKPEGRFARLELRWEGTPPEASIADWERLLLESPGSGSLLTQVLERHGGEAWCAADKASGVVRFCMHLPTTTPAAIRSAPSELESRPEYYDFDLFSQPGQNPELDERKLSELSYTVFDTETTGLKPTEGDEIISIGAVRIVNGRLLKREVFDQLIDPRRSVSRESLEIHGIAADMLAGQPVIDDVLPSFHRFAEDTVLVAHNAAFDMRFLQLKEARTGVRFIQPVLDTLLLSAVAHPGFADAEHNLEAIAARLGVNVFGRHTALGDAIVTGEIFLRLVPLLADRGIFTLKEAREASRKTLYARLEY